MFPRIPIMGVFFLSVLIRPPENVLIIVRYGFSQISIHPIFHMLHDYGLYLMRERVCEKMVKFHTQYMSSFLMSWIMIMLRWEQVVLNFRVREIAVLKIERTRKD